VEDVEAQPGPADGTWIVTVHVVVGNDTDAAVDVTDIEVAVEGERAAITLDDAVVEPGGVGRYDVPVQDAVTAAEAPTTATARLTWRWLDHPDCPAAPVATEQPAAPNG
jgi:hypothetical protein